MKKQFLFIVIVLISFTQLNAQDQIAMLDTAPVKATVKKEKITSKDITEFKNEEKVYPELAMDYSIEGRVVLGIEFDGEIQSVKVVKSGGELLDNAALKAVKEYEKHYQAEGKKTKLMNIYVPFSFKL